MTPKPREPPTDSPYAGLPRIPDAGPVPGVEWTTWRLRTAEEHAEQTRMWADLWAMWDSMSWSLFDER